MTLKCFIITIFFIRIESSSDLIIFHQTSFELQPNTSYLKQTNRELLCMSNNPRDVIVWNTNEIVSDTNLQEATTQKCFKEKFTVPEVLNPRTSIVEQCKIGSNPLGCFSMARTPNYGWKFAHSFETPMGPVYDSRWENFKYTQAKSAFKFKENSSLVFSIRGPGKAELLICEMTKFGVDFCYRLNIKIQLTIEIVLNTCPYGIPKGFPSSALRCIDSRVLNMKKKSNLYEWQTFILMWKVKKRNVKLFDPDKLILSYDHEENITPKSSRVDYVISTDYLSEGIQLRLHNYGYLKINGPNNTLKSEPFTFANPQKICIDLLVGLCKQCRLDVNILDANFKQFLTKKIERSPSYKNIEHDLPMWQYETIQVNISEMPIRLELKTVFLGEEVSDVEKHWAIAKFEDCMPEGTVNKIKFVSCQDFQVNLSWPEVSCQKLSYNSPHSEVLTINRALSEPPDDIQYCPYNHIGPKCVTNCSDYFQNDCNSIVACTESGCFCNQGLKTMDSRECNSVCDDGFYGYGCTENCHNCLDQQCNPYTGKCKSGCVTNPTVYFVPPYCKMELKIPATPIIDNITVTSAQITSYLEASYEQFNPGYSFQVTMDDKPYQMLKAKIQTNTSGDSLKSYASAIIENLTPGIRYQVKLIVRISDPDGESYEFHGYNGNFYTKCKRNKEYTFTSNENSITIERKSEQGNLSCPDSWYIIELFDISSNNDSLRKVHLDKLGKKFPITLKECKPFTKYNVCISGQNNATYRCELMSTQETAPSAVVNLRMEFIKSTEAIISWQSPLQLNGILRGYNLTIKVHSYKACEINKIPARLKRPDINLKISPSASKSIEIKNLIPYVKYIVTVEAYSSKRGDRKEIYFDTQEQETPTSIFSNMKFSKNRITWENPVDCWTISGPIVGARIFMFGVSENVVSFLDQHDTQRRAFELNITKPQDIHGNERYRMRIHVLHELLGNINETAYTELNFTTDPRPPPKVRDLRVVNVDEQNTTLRWKVPSPPTEGEIIYYTIEFAGENGKQQNVVKVYPDETCYAWKDSICKTIAHPVNKTQYIEVKAYNKGVTDPGVASQIDDTRYLEAPEAPYIVSAQEVNNSVLFLKWHQHSITDETIEKFIIHLRVIHTELALIPWLEDIKIIENPISSEETEYDTYLQLLPSTRFQIAVQGITNNSSGKFSSIEIETKSALAFAYDPKYIINSELALIDIVIPPVIYDTKGSMLHIVVKGPLKCIEGGKVNPEIEQYVDTGDNEEAWRVTTYPTHKTANLSFTIGDDLLYDSILNCPLQPGNSYVIFIIVRQKKHPSSLHEPQTIVWNSQPIYVGSKFNHYEYWLIPLILLVVVAAGIYYYHFTTSAE